MALLLPILYSGWSRAIRASSPADGGNVSTTEATSEAITGIQREAGSAVSPPGEITNGVFDHCVLAAKLARLMLLFPEPPPLSEPYKVLQFRQVVLQFKPDAAPAPRPIAIDTRRPFSEAS
jgi:hypothetical protein